MPALRLTPSLADYFDAYGNITQEEEEDLAATTTTGPNPTIVPELDDDSWGDKRDALAIVVPITVVYALIFVTGVIGNVSTCVVISRNKSMHTATNYYLFSLAVSDLLLLVVGLPPEMCYIWSKYPYLFGEAFCVLQGFAAETSANATVLTITAFTVERYVAICHPFLSHTMSKLSRAVKFIMAIWVVAMCLAVPQAIAFGIVYESEDHYVCTVKQQIVPHAFELSTIVFFVAPMSLISVLYILIALQLRKSRIVQRGSLSHSVELKHRATKTHSGQAVQTVVVCPENVMSTTNEQPDDVGHNNANREDGRKNYHRNMHSKATKHVVNMLVAVVVAFFICWAPFHAQRLLAIHAQDKSTDIVTLYTCLTYLSGVMYYLSTCINPFLYNIMSNKFRNAFRETLSRYISIGGRSRTPVRRYSTLSLPRSNSPTRSQSLSHSGGASRTASLRRARDSDMARRPLVVSFRKPRSNLPSACIHAPRCACRIGSAYNRQDPNHPTIEETCIDSTEPPVTYAPSPKVRLFKKWGKKKHVSKKVPCTVICSECHRHLSNDSELHNKLALSQEFSSSSMSEATTTACKAPAIHEEESDRQMRDNLKSLVESDLIPHHMCPKQFGPAAAQEPRNGFVNHHNPPGGNHYHHRHQQQRQQSYGVSHSRTMPDIVKYSISVKKKSRARRLRHNNGDSAVARVVMNSSDDGVKSSENSSSTDANFRKWGSVENLSYDLP